MTINWALEGLPGQLCNRDTKLLLTVYLVFRLNLLDLKPCPWDPGLIANAALWQLKWQAASWHIFMPYFYPKNDTIRNVWIPNSHNISVIWWRRFHILCSRETWNTEGYFFKISKVVILHFSSRIFLYIKLLEK